CGRSAPDQPAPIAPRRYARTPSSPGPHDAALAAQADPRPAALASVAPFVSGWVARDVVEDRRILAQEITNCAAEEFMHRLRHQLERQRVAGVARHQRARPPPGS